MARQPQQTDPARARARAGAAGRATATTASEALRAQLRAAGLDDGAIDAAAQAGRLPTLAAEVALGSRPRHTLTAVAKASRLDTGYVRELLQAVGLPSPARGERAFGDEDLRMAQLARGLLDAGLPRDEVIEIARITSQGLAPVADAIRRTVGDALLRPGDDEATVGLRYAGAVKQLAPVLPTLLDYQVRVHLRDAVRRALVTEAEREAGSLAHTTTVAIGFADLVGWTKLGERVSPEDLGQVATTLARAAARSLQPPTTLVKTIGDAVMLASPEPEALLASVVELRRRLLAEDLPAVRVGMACGPATSRGGDWFGSTVNLASRVTGAAKAGQVLATPAFTEAAPHDAWRKRRKRSLKGIDGRQRLFSLELPDAPADD